MSLGLAATVIELLSVSHKISRTIFANSKNKKNDFAGYLEPISLSGAAKNHRSL